MLMGVALLSMVLAATAFATGYTNTVKFGSSPSDPGNMNNPNGVGIDSDGNVYVADSNNFEIDKYDSEGVPIDSWGSEGTGPGQFSQPNELAVDAANGFVYVVDTPNLRIEKFELDGDYVTEWPVASGEPYGLATDAAGNVYVVNSGSDVVIKYSPTGTQLDGYGTSGGSGAGEFIGPQGIALDASENMYVVDGQDRIQVLDSTGTFVRMWGWGVDDGSNALQVCTASCEAGINGAGDGQFENARGIAVHGSTVYVTDVDGNRVQRFSTAGAYLGQWGGDGFGDGEFNSPHGIAVSPTGDVYVADWAHNRMEAFSSTGAFERKWGTSVGTNEGEFVDPQGIVEDSQANIYVVDQGNNRVQKFDNSGNFKLLWGWGVDDGAAEAQTCTSGCQEGAAGGSTGQFDAPTRIAVDSQDRIYVTDTGNHRVQKFTNEGTYLDSWGSFGGGQGQLSTPFGVAVDGNGNVYVGDALNNRIQKFDTDGNFKLIWGWGVDDGSAELQTCTSGCQPGSAGGGDGQIQPIGVAVDAQGHVYVVDNAGQRIEKFSSDGAFLGQWGGPGSGDGQFNNAWDIAVDLNGTVIVADRGNDRVQLFTDSGTFIAAYGSSGFLAGEFESPNGVAADCRANLLVTDGDDALARVQQFTDPAVPPPPCAGSSTAPPGSGGGGGGAQIDRAAPTLSLTLRPKRFAVKRKAKATLSAKRKARKRKQGTRLRYALSEAAAVKFTVAKPVKGRRAGEKCKKATARKRKGKRCTIYKSVGSFGVAAKKGVNGKKFSGKLRRRALRPGSYRLSAVARDASGNASVVKNVRFRVLKP